MVSKKDIFISAQCSIFGDFEATHDDGIKKLKFYPISLKN